MHDLSVCLQQALAMGCQSSLRRNENRATRRLLFITLLFVGVWSPYVTFTLIRVAKYAYELPQFLAILPGSVAKIMFTVSPVFFYVTNVSKVRKFV